MKRILSIILSAFVSLLLIQNLSYAEGISKQINANVKTKRVPVGTIINLKLLDPVNSSTQQLGDSFDLMVVENVKVDNIVVIPEGTVVRGSIDEIRSPQMLYKGGLVRLYFDHIVSATGKQVPFYAGIRNNKNITYDGALSSNTNYGTAFSNTVQNTKNIVVKSTQWSWKKGEELFNGTPKYVFAPVTAIFSAPVAGIYFVGDSVADIFKKGPDVNVNQGEILQVQLLKPIDMPVY